MAKRTTHGTGKKLSLGHNNSFIVSQN